MQIEAGKFYRTRDGRKIGPIRLHTTGFWAGAPGFPDAKWYTQGNPTFGHLPGACLAMREMPDDIIAEWIDEAVEAIEPIPVSEKLAAMTSEPMAGEIKLGWFGPDTSDAYAPLAAILSEAYDQAATGKGKERHANDRDFIDQPIMEIGRMCGAGFNTGQAMKKIQEAMGMLSRGQPDAAIRELLGAVNYTASAVILIREGQK